MSAPPTGQSFLAGRHFALDLSLERSMHGGPSLTGSLLSPASALGPPRGLGGGGALLRRPTGEEFRHVHEQAKANREDAVGRKSPREGGAPHDNRPSPDASEFEAGAGSGPTAPSERGHHRRHHGFHRLAAA